MKDTKNNKLLTIDILKGIAIWMVIMVHSRQTLPNLVPWLKIFDIGQMGCQIFFVVSGVSAMMSYERLESKRYASLEFYKKRIMSIIPGWYAAIFFSFIINTILLALFGKTIGFAENRQPISILCNLLLIHGLLPFCNNNVYGGGWFVGTIAVFYFITPIIYKILSKKSKCPIHYVPWLVEALSCFFIIGTYLHTKNNAIIVKNGFFYFSFINQIGCFLLGATLYFELKNDEKIRDNLSIRKLFCAIYFVLLIYMFFSTWRYSSVFVSFIMGLFTYHFMICMLSMENRNCYLLENSFIINIIKAYGAHSYYIYLIHFLFVWTMPLMLKKILPMLNIYINDNILYSTIIIPIFIFAYYTAVLFERIIKKCLNILLARLCPASWTARR